MSDAIQSIKDGLIFLSNRCDGAKGQDGIGFNGGDTEFGKSLAAKVRLDNKLTKKQLETAQMMLVKYTRQLKDAGVVVPTFGELATAIDLQMANKKVVTLAPRATITPASTKTVTYNQKTNKLEVRFDFSYDIVALVKSIEPKGKFDGAFKKWDFNLSSLSDLVAKLQPNGFTLDAGVMNQLHNLESVASLSNERLELISRYLVSDASKWRVTPFKHQWEGVRFITSQSDLRAIVADEQGLGKTTTSLIAAKGIKAYHEMMGEVVEILIICPASLTRNWKIEADKIGLDAGVSIYSYEKIPTDIPSNKYLVITDEFHKCQSLKAIRTQKLLSLTNDDNCISLIGLTGTPMNNGKPMNLYPLLKMINHPIAANKSAYDVRYCDAKSTHFCKWNTSGAINLDELNERIKTKVIRRLKTDCLDLPAKMFIDVTCDDNSDAEKEYQSEFKRVVKEYKERVKLGKISGNSEALVMLGNFRKLSSLYKTYEAIERAKTLLESNQSVVIFTQFVESAKRIAEHFDVECLTGETPVQKTVKGKKVYPRQMMVENFQSGKTKVFVSTIGAGGVGITLTASNHLIMVDLPWTVGDYAQATDRVHRIGSEGFVTEDGGRAVNIYTLYAKPVDYTVAAMLQRKTEIVEAVLADCGIKPDMSYEDLITKLIKAK